MLGFQNGVSTPNEIPGAPAPRQPATKLHLCQVVDLLEVRSWSMIPHHGRKITSQHYSATALLAVRAYFLSKLEVCTDHTL